MIVDNLLGRGADHAATPNRHRPAGWRPWPWRAPCLPPMSALHLDHGLGYRSLLLFTCAAAPNGPQRIRLGPTAAYAPFTGVYRHPRARPLAVELVLVTGLRGGVVDVWSYACAREIVTEADPTGVLKQLVLGNLKGAVFMYDTTPIREHYALEDKFMEVHVAFPIIVRFEPEAGNETGGCYGQGGGGGRGR